MSRIPDEIIEQVKDATDIVSLVGESVDLKRTGSDFRGPCPFHGGTNRNFAVIPRKGLFYCYVCHEAGDVFSYLMKRFGMDYPTAVRELARKAGIVVPERSAQEGPDPNEPLYAAVAVAHQWFAERLREAPDADEARRYLASREIPMDAAAAHGLGWAPQGPAFLDAMRKLGQDEDVMLQAGLLFKREDGSVVSRFRNRLLFPIHDLRGRAVGFGGRLLGPGEPKYLNSPETPIFHKGRQLYNLHHARQAIRQEQVVLVVEGYFDVLRLVLAGIEHVVAPLGTATTADQAALLKRLAPTAILLYDSDKAGLRATFKAGDELLRHGMRVRVATMAPGEDPDTLVQKGGAAALEPVLRDAVDVLERKIQLLERSGWFEDVEHRREALDRLLPTIRAASDPITRDLYLALVAERTGVSREVLEKEAKVAPAAPPPAAEPSGTVVRREARSPAEPARRRPPPGTSAERVLLALFLADPDWLDRARREVPVSWIERPALRELYEALLSGATPETLAERLSPDGIAAWQRLQNSPELVTGDHDQAYVGAVRLLEARPLFREYSEVLRRSRAEADPAGKDALVAEAFRLRDDGQRRFPNEWARYMQFQKRGGQRPGGANAT